MDFNLERSVMWIGAVNAENGRGVMKQIDDLAKKALTEEITLFISSGGGTLEPAFALYELVRLLKLNLTTVALAEASSSAVMLFLMGNKRFVTPGTSMLLHMTARTYKGETTLDTTEIAQQLRDLQITDKRYVDIVSRHTNLSAEQVHEMRAANTVLDAKQLVEYGFAQAII